VKLGGHLETFCRRQLLKNSSGNGFLGRYAWSFKPKNHSKSLIGPYECKLQ
jgi:hypothetical protein